MSNGRAKAMYRLSVYVPLGDEHGLNGADEEIMTKNHGYRDIGWIAVCFVTSKVRMWMPSYGGEADDSLLGFHRRAAEGDRDVEVLQPHSSRPW